jgi:hypothetical protein
MDYFAGLHVSLETATKALGSAKTWRETMVSKPLIITCHDRFGALYIDVIMKRPHSHLLSS